MVSHPSTSDLRRHLRVLEECLEETALHLDCWIAAHSCSVLVHCSAGTATAVDIHTEPEPAVVQVPPLAVAHMAALVVAAVVAPAPALVVLLAGSWLQQLETTVPMQPSWLAGSAGLELQVVGRTVQGLHTMPLLQVAELVDMQLPAVRAVDTGPANLYCYCLYTN
jgi:hypothetical protein